METLEFDLFKIVLKFYRFIVRYLYLFTGALIIGLIIGGITTFKSPRYYENTITALARSKQLYIGLLENIQKQIEQEYYYMVAKDLKLTYTEAKSVKKISIEKIYTINASKNEKEEQAQFEIKILVNDSGVVNKIAKSMQFVAENNSYLNEVYELDKKQKHELIDNYVKELNHIDSIRSHKTELKTGQIILEENTKLQQQWEVIFKQKQDVEADLQLNRPFIIFDNKTQSKIFKTYNGLFIYPLFLLFLTLSFAFLRDIILRIWKEKTV
jgi:hypothetical protein